MSHFSSFTWRQDFRFTFGNWGNCTSEHYYPTSEVSSRVQFQIKALTGLTLGGSTIWCLIDIHLGPDVFSHSISHGQRRGPRGFPAALETCFSCVLAGSIDLEQTQKQQVTEYFSSHSSGMLLQKYWKVESFNSSEPFLTTEEKEVMQRFQESHTRNEDPRYIVPFLRNINTGRLGGSQSNAVQRFL